MKSFTKIILKTVAFSCVIAQLFILISMSSFAYSQDEEDLNKTDAESLENQLINTDSNYLNNTSEIAPQKLTFSINNPSGMLPGTTRVIFDATDVIEHSCIYNGINVVERQTMVFDLIANNNEFGTFELTCTRSDGSITHNTLYTYFDGSSITISDVSKDSAWHQRKLILHNNGFLTIDDWHEQYSAFSLLYSESETDYSFVENTEVNEAVSSGKIVVRGRMTWTTENNVVLPLKYTKVELRDWYVVSSASLATTYTDENGYYCFIFDPNDFNIMPNSVLGLFVRTYTESTTFNVGVPFLEEFNYYDSNIEETSASEAKKINICRRIKNDNDYVPYRLMYIQQGMVVGQQFALEMGMETNVKLYVFYPGDLKILSELNNFQLPFQIPEINDIAFCYNTISMIGHEHYNNFSTTIHEYGHYVENRMGVYGPNVKGHLFEDIPTEFNGLFEYLGDFISSVWENKDDYTHNINVNHFGDNTTKAFQTELTWSEAWASAFSEIAIENYDADFLNAGVYTAQNYEIVTITNESGEAQEKSVIAFLWDLYDAHSSVEIDDNIRMTEQDWWNLTTKVGTYTLQDFSENILENYPELISGIGELMSKHKISPELMYVSYNFGQIAPPHIRLKVNGGASYPNNKLSIAFYDHNELLMTTSQVSVARGSSEEFFYYISTNDWNNVLALSDFNTTIYAVIYGYRTDGTVTSGPYFSKAVLVYDVYSYHKDHIKEYTSITASSHTLLCDCGFSVTSNHHAYRYSHIPNNTSSHRAYCECGKEWTEPHVIESGSYTGVNKYAICLCCRALVTVGMTIHPTTSDLLRTENGSYILPNGVIVLVREDIEAYFAGTLEFYYPDENLETE